MSATADTPRNVRLHTIGAVCDRLREEFPDISISKIRYLEDQGLLRPKRTRGGYRLFAETDVERLETILRLQRDAFLPLRVIKEELATATPDTSRRRGAGSLQYAEPELEHAELLEHAGIDAMFARELEEFDLLGPRIDGGERYYPEGDAHIAACCARIAQHGVDARHLRAFKTSAGRQSGLIEQIVAPGLRSRDAERRKRALAELEALAAAAQELARLLLLRDLKDIANR